MGLMAFVSRLFKQKKSVAAGTEDEYISQEIFFPKEATILIVDDSKTQVATCEKWLRDDGYTTLAAYDGREGIMLARKEHPDLILMDIVMPDVNGFQATRYLKKQPSTKSIPIVLISGEEQSSGKLWAKKLGASSFMVKPLKKDSLLRLVQKILEYKALHTAEKTSNAGISGQAQG